MSADMLTAPAARPATGGDVVTAAATVWATLCVLDELPLEPGDRARNSAAQRHLAQQLQTLGLEKSELHEHIVSAVERGDWAALGIDPNAPPHEDRL